MTLTQNDHTDIGTLIAYALQPTQRPGRSQEYRRVLGRYRTESDFRIAIRADGCPEPVDGHDVDAVFVGERPQLGA